MLAPCFHSSTLRTESPYYAAGHSDIILTVIYSIIFCDHTNRTSDIVKKHAVIIQYANVWFRHMVLIPLGLKGGDETMVLTHEIHTVNARSQL